MIWRTIYVDRAHARAYSSLMKRVPGRVSPPSRSLYKTKRVRIDDGPFAVVGQRDLFAVFWGTVPLYSFRAKDRLGRYAAAVDLVRLHDLPVRSISKAFGLGERTIFRLLRRFEDKGVDGLLGRKRYGRPTKILDAEARQLLELKRQGASHSVAARRLGVTKSGVQGALRRLGWKEPCLSGWLPTYRARIGSHSLQSMRTRCHYAIGWTHSPL